ncbi:unnamed protein product [Litomosoides sigmodontis]|uniref:Bromodomain associated domain-containing protein n=1 Tax=Litomosoides sigmodontis TaxID=42156 RepID=A0A3P6U180_LITSI|nr:unnamed protein product [Litomosoides sigmodontis]
MSRLFFGCLKDPTCGQVGLRMKAVVMRLRLFSSLESVRQIRFSEVVLSSGTFEISRNYGIMSIIDIAGTDHVGEIVPSTDDDSSTKVAEDQLQEEGSDEKQQNHSWITTIKPTFLSQGTSTDYLSLEPSEDYAMHYLTRSVLKMMDNIGFSTCHESVLDILTDLCRRYMQKLWIDSKAFAEHAGRRYPIFEDAHMVFDKLMFSAAELHLFMKQVEHDPLENNVPLFPIKKSSINLLSIYGPVSDKELSERPEHIPHYFPAMHPEWCSSHTGVRAVGTLMKDTAQKQTKNDRCTPRGRAVKSKISFPDFSGLTAKELGFVRPQKLPPIKVIEEPSGISSSANIAALQTTSTATSNNNRTKLRKSSMHEPASSSKYSDEYHVKTESSKGKDTSKRSIGMFGMPPSALVHQDSVETEKMKKKRKRDRGRVKDRTREGKVKHRDKEKLTEKNEENQSADVGVPVTIESLTSGKADTSEKNCSVDVKNNAKKSANQQDVPLALHKQQDSAEQQIEQDLVNLKNVTNGKSVKEVYVSHCLLESRREKIAVCGKEVTDKVERGHSVDVSANDDHNASNVDLQMTSGVLVPQHFSNRYVQHMPEIYVNFLICDVPLSYVKKFSYISMLHSVVFYLHCVAVCEAEQLHFSLEVVMYHSVNRVVLNAGDVKDDGVNNGSKAVEKAKKEGVKDGIQKNEKRDPSRSAVVEIATEKLGKRKAGEKGCEWKKVARTTGTEISLSVHNDVINSTTDITPLLQDVRALKVVLSRSTGQKVFTALSPSSGTERAIKEVEQKCDSGSVQGGANVTPFSIDESQVSKNICEKKKHRKEKDRDKYHNKEHKRKDKEKYKEHKKNKAKDDEKKCIKLRPEGTFLKRPGEHIPSGEMPTPKIPKLKIRFGSSSSTISASPSVSTTSTILTSTLSSDQLSERDNTSLAHQNTQVTQSANKVEDAEATNLFHTCFKSDVNIKPKKRQPVTKAELKALPKSPLKARTCGAKECILFMIHGKWGVGMVLLTDCDSSYLEVFYLNEDVRVTLFGAL